MGIEQWNRIERQNPNLDTKNASETLQGFIDNPDIPESTRLLLTKAQELPESSKQELLKDILPLLPGAIANAKWEVARINNSLAKLFQGVLDPVKKIEVDDSAWG